MFLCYLIDPEARSVTKVRDGFDRAPELTDSDEAQLAPLWHDLSDSDSSVDIAHAADPGDSPAFRFTLRYGGQRLEKTIAGKGVLIACGAVPDEIASQVATTDAVSNAVAFLPGEMPGAAEWLRKRAPARRAPATRAPAVDRFPQRKKSAGPGAGH